MFSNRTSSFHHPDKRSSALIITLAAIILLTTIVLVFFQLSTLNRKVSFSSAGQYRADVVANTAMNTIIGDFRSEIIAGSIATNTIPSSSTNLYLPSATVTVPYGSMEPSRIAVVTQGFPNLVTQSASGQTFWNSAGDYGHAPGITNPIRSAAGNSTQTSSLNGRQITSIRWNKPGLLSNPGTTANPIAAAPPGGGTAYVPPDWVIITRQGPVVDATTPIAVTGSGSLSDRSAANMNFAVGRYAYTVYNEGALLDANVAGMPTTASSPNSSTFVTERGLLPQVDLANLLSATSIGDGNASTDANGLVTWRNAGTTQSPLNYTNYISNATNGFTTVLGPNTLVTVTGTNSPTALAAGSYPVPAPGDQAFATRQDLLDYVENDQNQSSISPKALPFLTTFTRDLDAPSFYPTYNSASTLQDNITNPNVMSILVQTSFTRPDGTTAQVGDPLVKHRFALSRLALFQNPGANAGLILKYFCMKSRSDGLWDYVDPDTKNVMTSLPTIKTLALVAQASPGREPTFWEMLQAGILVGSLGAERTSSQTGMDLSQNLLPARQVLSIGLSIMDQYDADATPTVLRLGGVPGLDSTPPASKDMFVAGVENLPYITWINEETFQDSKAVDAVGATSPQDGYMVFGLWNPHRNAASANPGQFAIRMSGTTGLGHNPASPLGKQAHNPSVLPFQTTTARNFAAIDVLRPGDAPSAITSDVEYSGTKGRALVGFSMGSFFYGTTTSPTAPPLPAPPTQPNPLDFCYVTSVNIVLGTYDKNQNFIPYQVFSNYDGDFGQNTSQSAYYYVSQDMDNATAFGYSSGANSTQDMVDTSAHSDPRTQRFGFQVASSTSAMAQNNFNLVSYGAFGLAGQTIGKWLGFNEGANSNANGVVGPPFVGVNGGTSTSGFTWLADYAYNSTKDNYSCYTDPDGLIRQGDSNPTTYTSHSVNSPYEYKINGVDQVTSPSDAQPIMLNRPFTSVAEMGYAFRDDPWRTLNFSSSDSADGGLLDLFCLNENYQATRAGVVDINGASLEVLTALLENEYRDPAFPNTGASSNAQASPNTTTPLTSTLAVNIAQAIRTALGTVGAPASGNTVLHNSSDLPALITKIAASLPDAYKYKREGVSRALADVMNTRTWNLMIDVIAQSGHYVTASKTLDDFVVEGERRYWVHVAIDRFTGKVVATQLEPVNE